MLKEKKQLQAVPGADSSEIHDRMAEAYFDLMEKLESAFRQTGLVFHDELSLTTKKRDSAYLKERSASELIATLKQRVMQEQLARRAAEQALEETNVLLEETQTFLQEERTALQQQLAQWSQQEKCASAATQEAERNRFRLEAELATATQKYREVTEQLSVLKQRVAQEEAAKHTAEQTLRETSTQLEQTQSRFQEEHNALQQRLDGELETLRSRLAEANQKYRAATEQISTLKQRVTQEEASRRMAEQMLKNSTTQLEQYSRLKEESTSLQQRLEGELSTVRSRLTEANEKYRGASEQITTLKQRLTEEETGRRTAEHTLQENTTQLGSELEAVRSRLGEANEKYRGATEQITVLKQRLTEEEKGRRSAEQTLEDSTTRLEQERAVLQQQLTQWSEQAQASHVEAQEAEKNRLCLEGELEAVRNRLGEANEKYRAVTEQIVELKQRVTEGETARRAAEQALEGSAAQLEQLQEERAALQQQLSQWMAEGQTKTTTVNDAEKNLIRLEAELEAMHRQLSDASEKYASTTEQITALQQRVKEEESIRRTAEHALQGLTMQLQQTEIRLQQERAGLQQQLSQWTAEAQTKTVATHEAEKQLIRLEGQQEVMQSRLSEANEKYRRSTEQVTVLKQRVTEEEAVRRTAEQALRERSLQLEQTQSRLQKERADLQQRLEGELDAVRTRLAEANEKYRGSTEQITVLKELMAHEELSRRAAEQALRRAAEQLDHANLKYREATGKQIPELKNKIRTLAESTRQLERTRQQKIAAEQQLIKTRGTISFRLGYLLTHNFKSINGVLGLPSELWTLRKDAVQRRKKKVFAPGPFKLPPSSGPSFIAAPESIANAASSQVASSQESAIPSVTASSLPAQPKGASVPNGKLKVACIMDDFTFGSFQPECALHQLTPGNWASELAVCNPDLLFIESAWRGKDELWGNRVGHASAELRGIVHWCRTRTIPTVFWNKEDPIHFETFLNTAKLFDYVFTTDIDCIHRYKAALGHDRVYLLPFACQPAAHNPIETYQRKDAFCFAGAYYVRYPERTRDLNNFVMELPSFRPLEIYDRNYGKNDPNYQFPEEYRQYIVGTLPFDQIDKAYKGYRYAINLNSIKQSQSMFARRVFELLACNTITISNFSRGLRMLFGDLVITSDSGSEIVRRLNKVADNEAHSRKFRLAALRKVMQEHTYGQRLAYVISKISGKATEQLLPHIAVLAYAGSHAELEGIQANYQRQRHANTSLHIVVGDGISPPLNRDPRVQFLSAQQAGHMVVDGLDGKAELLAGMVAEDYYGSNYLTDIALATRYTQADLIGKAARYAWNGGTFQLNESTVSYRRVQCLSARAAAVRRHAIQKENVLGWVKALATSRIQVDHGLAIDEFNYCENGTAADAVLVREQVDDLRSLNTGITINQLLEKAESIVPASHRHDECPIVTGKQLAADFRKKPSDAITLEVDDESWRVGSMLPDGKHEYLYATADHSLNELGFTDQLKLYLDVTPGLNIQLVVLYLDAQKQKISHIIMQANRNQNAVIPPGTARIRWGLRIYAAGNAEIKGLVLGHRNLQPAEMICQAEHLLLTNHYPAYSDLYRNGFVHTRVRAYQARGVRCDVFRLRADETVSYHEFEDVNVFTASQEVLHKMLCSGRYKSVLVHFLDSTMWEVLQHHIERIKVVVWVHGAEIRPWHRRAFDYQTEEQVDTERKKSDKRMAFWRELLQPVPANLKLVFVSCASAEEVMQDLGFRIPEKHYTIIHNPIETELFRYEPKGFEQRKKVLSIRPYASKLYANDLSVKTIQILSKKPWFSDMEFRIIGDGPLFEETIAPLRKYNNVYVEQRFLRHDEIAALHKEYGVFLCPTRMDTQGVSRDEAMSSGLVPVTNGVTAIPEFVDDTCGILAPAEDAEAMARGISQLYEQPLKFAAMSEAAARRVRDQRDAERIVTAELAAVLDNSGHTQ